MPYITNDGGKTWNIPRSFKNNKFFIYDFINEKQWWALDKNKTKLYKTNDSGQTWKEVSENKIFNDIKYIEFMNDKVGFAIGDHVFIRTVDGGGEWNNIKLNTK